MRFSTPWNLAERKSSRKTVTPPLPWSMHRSSARRKSEHRFPAYWFNKIAGKKETNGEKKKTSPRRPVRVKRNEDALVVKLDVQGYRLPQLMVSHYDGELVLTGAKQSPMGWLPNSKRKDQFTKYVNINEEVDWDSAEAELKDGELQVTLPRVGNS